jgi:hypothetical protein
MKESKEEKDISPYCCVPDSSRKLKKTTNNDLVHEKPFPFMDLPRVKMRVLHPRASPSEKP